MSLLCMEKKLQIKQRWIANLTIYDTLAPNKIWQTATQEYTKDTNDEREGEEKSHLKAQTKLNF
jgi:hypothetical protein